MKRTFHFLKKIYIQIFSSKIILTTSSFYLFLIFYLINNEILIFKLNDLFNYLIYILFGGLISYVCFIAIKNKDEKDHQDQIQEIFPVEFEYISIYLGLFIISLELSDITNSKLQVLILISIIYIIWLKLESVSFFNFYWLLFGYRFYQISTNKSKYILISKRKDVKNKKSIKSLELKRINNYTFLEINKND